MTVQQVPYRRSMAPTTEVLLEFGALRRPAEGSVAFGRIGSEFWRIFTAVFVRRATRWGRQPSARTGPGDVDFPPHRKCTERRSLPPQGFVLFYVACNMSMRLNSFCPFYSRIFCSLVVHDKGDAATVHAQFWCGA